MAIGLCGAHGTGKTTLARAMVEFCPGMEMVESRASQIFKVMDLPLDRPLTFEERLSVQEAILDGHIQDVGRVGNFAISDRTPLDMATYMLGEWAAHSNEAQGKQIMRYVERCFKETNRLFSVVLLIQPGIPYVANTKRPPPNEAAVEMFNYLVLSLIKDKRLVTPSYRFGRETVDLDERKIMLCNVWNSMVADTINDRANCHVH